MAITVPKRVNIEMGRSHSFGATIIDNSNDAEPNAKVYVEVDKKRFYEIFYDCLERADKVSPYNK